MIVDHIGNLSDALKGKKSTFVLVIGTTDVSLIPGITVAGATPELTMFTPAADAEYLITGSCKVIKGVPVTPDGIPTPALLSRASLSLINVSKIIVNAGARVAPKISFVDLHGEPGRDIRKGGVRREVAENIITNATVLGENLSEEVLVVGESIPAGTTTAAAVLTGLGFNGVEIVSSSSPNNPKELKRKVVEEAVRSAPKDMTERIYWLADPVILAVAGLAMGFRGLTILAGGTQMAAVSAVIKELSPEKLNSVGIITTKWIVNDTTARLMELVKTLGVKLSHANLDLSQSQHEGLRVYERGFVKEGVGAGGAMALAMANGVTSENLVKKIDAFYSDLINAQR
ncbi:MULTISPECIES: nicotinate mononucleotide-dependent phosphoribosyltransferase CobT [Metallosphaera]|uniref:nicotinate mononucleotide-dependent phosphoribosyltransferase CobT n=1 Tax=Metallosphaera TaxID=41980 RepID=UPI00384E1EE8